MDYMINYEYSTPDNNADKMSTHLTLSPSSSRSFSKGGNYSRLDLGSPVSRTRIGNRSQGYKVDIEVQTFTSV